jgi:hypothetical protein
VTEAAAPETAAYTPSAKERKAARERARRAAIAKVEAEEAARLEAEERAKRAASPDAVAPQEQESLPAAPAPVTPERSDGEREREAAHFLAGVLFPVLAYVCPWFFAGWTLDLEGFTAAQASADATTWPGLMRAHPWLDRLVRWASPVAAIVARARAIARRKEVTP